MTLIDQQAAAVWHREHLDTAHRARLVRALRAQKRAGKLTTRSGEAVQRATAAGVLPC
ncbi:MAG TPA: hypothetical protein VFX33_09765 [Actinomycetales bacterium]|nr:hypothetical protein [Actinomycetales bacterium]